jgi:predicted RNA binding protein YcfA (HicA-like mRNA interferase family)
VLEKKGFAFSRQSGSHAIYKDADNLRVTIPVHGKNDIAREHCVKYWQARKYLLRS